MSRVNKPDVEQWLDHNVFRPTKTLLLTGEVDLDLSELAVKGLTILDSTRHEVPITILLNSDGGDCTQGMAIYNFIQSCKSEVHINVIGECYSMAVWILQAADVRRMYPHARMMVHIGEYGLASNHPEINKAWARSYERDEEEMISILANRMDVPVEELKQWITFDKILTPSEALTLRLIDEVID